jgi:hypothetical protein
MGNRLYWIEKDGCTNSAYFFGRANELGRLKSELTALGFSCGLRFRASLTVVVETSYFLQTSSRAF